MTTPDVARLNHIISDLAAQSRVGMAVTVIAPGGVHIVEGFGVCSVTNGAPVTADTLFYAASLSKLVTATAVVRLVERGRLRLDDLIIEYVPTLPLVDERARAITIRHLLTHTSGLPDVDNYGWDAPELDDGALERFVWSQAGRSLLFQPGEAFAYSNLAYSLLGAIVATVTGQTFESYVHAKVLAPLGMQRSTFLCPNLADPQTALPHVGASEPVPAPIYPYHRGHGPSSNFHTTAHDLSIWMQTHLEQGATTRPRLLHAETYKELWHPSWVLDAQRAVGLGWFLVTLDEIRWVGHAGHDPGFRAVCLIAPERLLGVSVLTNDDNVDMDRLAITLSAAVRATSVR